MAKRGKIERAGFEAYTLELSQQGLGSRAIAKKLLEDKGLKISHVGVSRFLTEELNEREHTRRLATAEAAVHLAATAGVAAESNLGKLQELVAPLLTMGLNGSRRVRLVDGPLTQAHIKRYGKGREWVERVSPQDQIRAAHLAKELLVYLVELAGGHPQPLANAGLDGIRAAIAEVFGYSEGGESVTDAPPTSSEHTPPVVH